MLTAGLGFRDEKVKQKPSGMSAKAASLLLWRHQCVKFVDHAGAAGAGMDRVAVLTQPSVARRLQIEARIKVDRRATLFQSRADGLSTAKNEVDAVRPADQNTPQRCDGKALWRRFFFPVLEDHPRTGALMMRGDADHRPTLDHHLRIVCPVRLRQSSRARRHQRRGRQHKKLDHRDVIMIRPEVRLDG